MLNFFLLWAIHGLAWFTLSALTSMIRGVHSALHVKSAFAFGLISALLNFLVLYYWRHL
jgi:hypothetical protein